MDLFPGTDIGAEVKRLANHESRTISVDIRKYPNYRGTYCGVYKDLHGVVRTFSCRTRDRLRAQEYYRQYVDRLIDHAVHTAHAWQTIDDLIPAFESFKEEQGVRQITVAEHVRLVKQFSHYLRQAFAEVRYVHEVRTAHIDAFVLSKTDDGKSAAAQTKRNRTSALKSFFDFACRADVIMDHPYQRTLRFRSDRKEAEYLSVEDLIHFTLTNANAERDDQWVVLFVLLSFLMNTRSKELREAACHRVDLHQRTLRLTDTKNREPRLVHLPSQAVVLIQRQNEWKRQHDNPLIRNSTYLFPDSDGRPYSASRISKRVKQVLRRSFPDRSRLTLHSLRHSGATYLYNAGLNDREVALALGHRVGNGIEVNRPTATDLYIHRDRARLDEAYERIPSLPALLSF